MEQQGGAVRLQGEIQLQETIQAKAYATHVIVNSQQPISVRAGQTNEFFEEQSMQITVNTGESELIDFLYQIGGDASMIRVRNLDLRPADANRYRLTGNITLNANYQKKSPAKPAPGADKPAGKLTLVPSAKKLAPAAAKPAK